MRKGVSGLMVAIFLVLISVGLSSAYLVWSRATQESVQEIIEEETERQIGEFNAGLAIVSVSDNQISIKNTGRTVLETDRLSVLLDGERVAATTDVATVGPGGIAIIAADGFVPGIRTIRVTGPLNTGDETREPILYPGTVAFWDFLKEDEGHPQDSAAGGTSGGTLNGTTKMALHLDESAGNTVQDSSAFANNGNLFNGVAWTSGISRNALRFDGIDDFVDIDADMGLGSTLTVEFWVNYQGTNRFCAVCKNDNAGNNEFLIFYERGAENNFDIYVEGVNVLDNTPAVLTTNKWHHITVTHDGTALKIYQDGELRAQTNTAPPNWDLTGKAWSIGQEWDGASRSDFFQGVIDEVAIHSRALSAAEVRERFVSKSATFSDYADGVHNDAVTLNVTYVRVPATDPLDVFDTLTIETWIKLKGGSTTENTVIIKNGSYALYVDGTTNQPYGRVWIQGGSPKDSKRGSALALNAWHHVVFTADGSRLKMYVDGALASDTDYVGQFPFTTSPVLIGVNQTAPVAAALNAELDYVGVYDHALTADEVKSIYEAGSE